MALTNDLITEFVKVTRDSVETKNETIVYGVIKEHEGKNYVQLDGSDLLTPITSTANVIPGERVTVMIKDHTATVTGNISSPAARYEDVIEIGNKITEVEILVADKVSTKQLDAQVGRIDQLVSDNVLIRESLTASEALIDELEANNVTINEKLIAHDASIEDLEANKIDVTIFDAKYATIENLDATNAEVHNLNADYATFKKTTTDSLTANDAIIKELDAKALTVDEADVKYANIDFSNIDKAAIEYFYATSGLIKDVTVGDGTITGHLAGVTITGDLIEGNTIKADKLVVKGEDGLYYKLNFESGAFTEGEAVPDNGLHGSVIIANSITAEKIDVKDLVAFGATIGGFTITDDAIYSGVKESIDNTTRGIYMDNLGQIAIGDSDNFLRYYETEEGTYELEISTVQELDDSLRGAIAEQNTSITQNCETIILSALDSYTETGDFESFKETVETQLAIMSDEIVMKFNTATEQISAVDGDMNTKFTELYNYIEFSEDGIYISEATGLSLELAGGVISFKRNGQQFGWWDGTDFYTGNIIVQVNERAQFGNFAFVPRSDGSLMFLKVGG